MRELPAYMIEAIHKYESVPYDGLVLYPFRVKHYEQFLIARQAIGFMQQSLPVELMSMPLLSALFKLDYDRAVAGEQSTGLFAGCLVALAYALRLAYDFEPAEDACRRLIPISSPDDPSRLDRLMFVMNGEEEWFITPLQFTDLRDIIAAQNGIEIPDMDANPELVQAEHDLIASKAPKLVVDYHKMIHGVAALSQTDEKEIYEWAVLKLHDRMESYKRVLDYIICGIGESQGTKWNGGNPCPNPWFEKDIQGSGALISLDSLAGGQATSTILQGEAARQHLSLVGDENTS